MSPVCRHALLAAHFGEPYPAGGGTTGEEGCGACDVCLGETKGLDEAEARLTAKKILSAAWRLEGRYGTGYVVSVLLGRAGERAAACGHDQLKVFGILKEAGEPAVRSWMDQLIVQDYLEITEEAEYPLLRITAAGRALCQDKGEVRLGLPVKPARDKKKSKALRAVGAGFSEADAALFDRLRVVRRALADKAGVPPYVICQDATLVEMAALKPATPEALLDIKGMGEKRVKKFGAHFLAALSGRQDLPE